MKLRRILIRAFVILASLHAATAAHAQMCPAAPKLTIGIHALDFQANKPLCSTSPGVFAIQLKAKEGYELDYEKISVKEKEGEIKIRKLTIEDDLLIVKVDAGFPPGDGTGDDAPKYMIRVEGVGELDPRVRIIPSFTVNINKLTGIEEYLRENYLISVFGLQEIEAYLRSEQTSIEEVLSQLPKPTTE